MQICSLRRNHGIKTSFLRELYDSSGTEVIEKCIGQDHGYIKLSERKIFIHKNLPNYAKVSTFFHEKGHLKCILKKCHCLNETRFPPFTLCEKHAFMNEIEESYRLKLYFPLLYSMYRISGHYGSFRPIDKRYKNASSLVIKTPLWEKANSYIKAVYGREFPFPTPDWKDLVFNETSNKG